MTDAAERTKPKFSFAGRGGNAFYIIGGARRTLEKAGYSEEEVQKFVTEAESGDYDNVIQTVMRWCDCSAD